MCLGNQYQSSYIASSCIIIWLHRQKYICLAIQVYFFGDKNICAWQRVSILIYCNQLYHSLATPTHIYLFGATGILFWRQKYNIICAWKRVSILIYCKQLYHNLATLTSYTFLATKVYVLGNEYQS